MPVYPGFVGPSNQTRSWNFDVERTFNQYIEKAVTGTPASDGALLCRPALDIYIRLTAGPVRGMFADNSSAGRCFAVSGGLFNELFASQSASIRGTVNVDSRPAAMASNGTAGFQLMVTSGGLGYLYRLDTGTFTQITDSEFPTTVLTCCFYNGVFIVLDDTGTCWFSDLEDGSAWNGLDFFKESQVSDKTVQIARVNDQLWLFGTQNTAPWYNSGDPSTPFQPIPNGVIQHGIGAPWSIAALDNTVMWVMQDVNGGYQVVRADGLIPRIISTPAIDHYLQQYRVSEAVGFAFQMNGHLWYVLNVPNMPTSLVYQVDTNTWVDWSKWNSNTMSHEPFRGRFHAMAFGRHLIGDRTDGSIYQAKTDQYVDRVAG